MRAASRAFILACAGFGLSAGSAQAADVRLGQALYETHCGACHYERVHSRKKSVITSLAALKLEVAKWAAQTDRRFTAGELEDIIEYLNRSHYRIAK